LNIRLDSFVCIDLETTGLDFDCDKIIEIGAVKYSKGEKAGEFSQLVNPGVAIPPEIETLTGISSTDVESAPSIDSAIPQFESFLDDNLIFVGHNVRFDIAFIKKHLSTKYAIALDTFAADTAALSRLVWPGLKTFSLAHMAEFLGIQNPPSHRALRDAQVTTELYLRAIAALAKMPKNIQNMVAGLIFGLQSKAAVLSSLESLAKRLPAPVEYAYDYGDNVIGMSEINPVHEYIDIHPDIITDLFDGPVRHTLKEYEERPQQIEMANQVIGAFNR
jgi:ATP-dependent DNA helicase DinG